jgi:hypothetical protein
MVKDLDPTVDVEYFSFCEALCLRNACIHHYILLETIYVYIFFIIFFSFMQSICYTAFLLTIISAVVGPRRHLVLNLSNVSLV